jgi:hypothetical protein
MQFPDLLKQGKGSLQRSSRYSVFNILRWDYEHYNGVPRINIYLLRILFTLMFLLVTYDSWTHIFNHTVPGIM